MRREDTYADLYLTVTLFPCAMDGYMLHRKQTCTCTHSRKIFDACSTLVKVTAWSFKTYRKKKFNGISYAIAS